MKKSKPEKVSLFKMFKKKSQPPAVEDTQQKEASQEDQTDVGAPSTEPQMVSRLHVFSVVKVKVLIPSHDS